MEPRSRTECCDQRQEKRLPILACLKEIERDETSVEAVGLGRKSDLPNTPQNPLRWISLRFPLEGWTNPDWLRTGYEKT
jgi:hypothetical protein